MIFCDKLGKINTFVLLVPKKSFWVKNEQLLQILHRLFPNIFDVPARQTCPITLVSETLNSDFLLESQSQHISHLFFVIGVQCSSRSSSNYSAFIRGCPYQRWPDSLHSFCNCLYSVSPLCSIQGILLL